jgi:hypothetical protein
LPVIGKLFSAIHANAIGAGQGCNA